MQQSMLPLSVVKDDKNIEDRILYSFSISHLTAAKQMAMNLGGYTDRGPMVLKPGSLNPGLRWREDSHSKLASS